MSPFTHAREHGVVVANPNAKQPAPGFVIRRRMRLLTKLASKAGSRHDVKLPLREVAPSLDIKPYGGGSRFVDKVNPEHSGGSDLAYDFNSLREEELLEMCYMTYSRDSWGGVVYEDPAVKLTLLGVETVADANRWWIAKAIEKEPATFLSIVIGVVIAVASWAVGRYVTPVSSPPPAAQVQGHENAPLMPHAGEGD